MQRGLLVEFSCNPHSLLDSPLESFTACEIICPWVTSGCYNRVDPSTPFLFMDPLSTLRRIPRTSKLHLTSWLNISKVNRSMAPRQMTLTISMAWEMPFGILYLQSTRLNGTVYSRIKKLILLEPKFRRNLLWELPSPMVTLRRISPSRTLLLSIRLRLLPLFQQSPRRRSTLSPSIFILGKCRLAIPSSLPAIKLANHMHRPPRPRQTRPTS